MKRINILSSIVLFLFLLSACYAQEDQNQTTGSTRSTPASAQMKQEIKNIENQIMDAIKAKDADQFGKFLSDDFRGINSMGIDSKDDAIKRMKENELTNMDRSDENIVFPADNVAILTYKSERKNVANGQDMSGTYNVSSVLVKENGQWKVIEHTMVKEEK